jgi:hypothetical protein
MEEVEYIIAKRKLKKVTEYLVKWVGCDEEENSWVPEDEMEEFAHEEMIEYNNRLAKEKEAQILDKKVQNKSPTGSPNNNVLRNVCNKFSFDEV